MEILNHPFVVVAIFACLICEWLISRHKKLKNYDGYEALSSLILISIDKIVALFTGSDGGPIVTWLWNHRILDLQFDRWINFALTFVAVEFMYYWTHWYNHHVNIGWATHIMHHSPTKYNLTLGYRLGITRLFSLGWLIFLPLILLGFTPKDLGLCVGIIFLYQFFIHTELVPKLGWLDKIVNTPSAHRVHHSSNQTHYNKNLGGLFLVFDHLFGTYGEETEAVGEMKYGLRRVMEKRSIWHEITCQWINVFHTFKNAKGIKYKFLALFGAPTRLPLETKDSRVSLASAE